MLAIRAALHLPHPNRVLPLLSQRFALPKLYPFPSQPLCWKSTVTPSDRDSKASKIAQLAGVCPYKYICSENRILRDPISLTLLKGASEKETDAIFDDLMINDYSSVTFPQGSLTGKRKNLENYLEKLKERGKPIFVNVYADPSGSRVTLPSQNYYNPSARRVEVWGAMQHLYETRAKESFLHKVDLSRRDMTHVLAKAICGNISHSHKVIIGYEDA